jgi:hypothetical protein
MTVLLSCYCLSVCYNALAFLFLFDGGGSGGGGDDRFA